jgi:RNA polymerase sigma factor (sigma-70 family)
MIVKEHQTLLRKLASRYCYLNYDDVYNECVKLLLEAYQQNLKNPIRYVKSKIVTYQRRTLKEKNHYYYGDYLDLDELMYSNDKTKDKKEKVVFQDNVNGILDKITYSEMLENLTEREKTIICLYFNYGYTEREIAKIIKVDQSTINRIKKKGIEAMKKYIK